MTGLFLSLIIFRRHTVAFFEGRGEVGHAAESGTVRNLRDVVFPFLQEGSGTVELEYPEDGARGLSG